MNKILFAKGIVLMFFISISMASASLTITDTTQDTISPGEEGALEISVHNNFNYDVDDVSLFLDLEKTIFISVGSSQKSLDNLNEDKTKTIRFTLKSSSSSEPGNYLIPYTLRYSKNGSEKEITGAVGVVISSKPKLEFSAYADKPVIGERAKLSFKIINKGFGDVKFVSVQIMPEGYKMISEDKKFIGDIASNDYDTAVFEVLFTKERATIIATVSYLDFENNEKFESVEIPLKVYSRKEAASLGIIKTSNAIYLLTIPLLVIILLIARKISKKRKLEKQRKFEDS